jgi:hypothetical protein
VASEAWNLAAAIGCLIGAILCTGALVALVLSDPTAVNKVAAVGTGIGALSCGAWVVSAAIALRRRK